MGNPVRYIDPQGMEPKETDEEKKEREEREEKERLIGIRKFADIILQFYNEGIENLSIGFHNFINDSDEKLENASLIIGVGGTVAGVPASFIAPPVGAAILGVSYTASTIADVGSISLKILNATLYTGDFKPVGKKLLTGTASLALGEGFKFLGRKSGVIIDFSVKKTKIFFNKTIKFLNYLAKYQPSYSPL